MNKVEIIVLPSFTKGFKRLKKKYHSILNDLKELGKEIESNPFIGTDLGGGLRKIRMSVSSKGKGKSGGARIITFNVIVSVDKTEVNLLYIYDKSDMESISKEELKNLLKENGL